MSVTPPARLLTGVSEPVGSGLRNKIESLEPYTFHLTPPELEYYSVLVGCKYEGVMILAAFAAFIPLRAVKHFGKCVITCVRVIRRSLCQSQSELISIDAILSRL